MFTRAEALQGGWTPRTIRTQLHSGAWTQLGGGRYVVTARWAEADLTDRHRMRALAAGLNRALVIHRESAACVYRFPVLTTPGRVAARHPSEFAANQLTTTCDVRVTKPVATVIDCARFLGEEAGLVVADGALRLQAVAPHELTNYSQELVNVRGREAACFVSREMDGRAESALESISRYRLLAAGVPRPELQQTLLRKYRVDFLWRAQKIIGEADGLAKYGSDEKAIRANLKAERVRERELQDAGYSIVRWMWDDIWFTPETVVAQISRKLRR